MVILYDKNGKVVHKTPHMIDAVEIAKARGWFLDKPKKAPKVSNKRKK